MAPRNRTKQNERLLPFPGLYVNDHGVYYVRHPITQKQASLQTKDFKSAVRMWQALNQQWTEQIFDQRASILAEKLSNLATPKSEGDNIFLSDYLYKWRTEILGHKKINGRIEWGECKVRAKHGPNKGFVISENTRLDYARDCQQLESRDESKFALSDPFIRKKIRKLLSFWSEKPTHYNGLRNTLSRVIDHAIEADVILDSNPVKDIEKKFEPKRQVFIPDDAYLKITEEMSVHRHNRRIMDGTWRAKICDLMYMMSQQPIDIFNLKENDGEVFSEPMEIEGELAYGVIRFSRKKTSVGLDLYMNKELAELWNWLLDFKRRNYGTTDSLIVNPSYLDMRSRGKPVNQRTFSEAWRDAAEKAGLGGKYRLQDLRKRGLTDEFVNQGENDKGAHETEAMAWHYRLIVPPKRARSTLKPISKPSEGLLKPKLI